VINDIEAQESYRSQILFRRVFDSRPVRLGTLDRVLPEPIVQALLDARNVTGFYTHQAHAINSFWKGRNVIVSTATASGKSIIYQVRTLLELICAPGAQPRIGSNALCLLR
jgi:DEAD/DEAH box helicase domain-containing protein